MPCTFLFLCVLCAICVCMCVCFHIFMCVHVCGAECPRATVGCVPLIGGGEIEPW